ncbi:ras-2 protein [Halenospora varia]|nr:ras-2 protein [Halenospora varia]
MPPYKITMLGAAGVGKTALTVQLICDYFIQSYDPTIEDFYRRQFPVDNEHCTLEILDTAGVGFDYFQDFKDSWIHDGEGFILVYSISSRSSFLRVQSLYELIQRLKRPFDLNAPNTSSIATPYPATHVPIVLVGNKCDKSTEREVSVQEGFELARGIGCQFVEASAKSSSSVQKAFYDVVRLLRRQHSTSSKADHVSLSTRNLRLKSRKDQYFKRRQFGTLASWARNCYSRSKIWKGRRHRNRKPFWGDMSR